MKKKIIIITSSVLVLIIALSSFLICKQLTKTEIKLLYGFIKNEGSAEASVKTDLSFDYYVRKSTDAVTGRYMGFKEIDSTITEFEFEVTESIYKSHEITEGDIVKIRCESENLSTNKKFSAKTFKEGDEYLLVLLRLNRENAEGTAYYIMGDMIINTADVSSARWKYGLIEIGGNTSKEALVNKVKEIAENKGFNEDNLY